MEVRVTAQVDATELAGMMNQPGLLGVWENNQVIHLYWKQDQWTEHILTAIEKAIWHLGEKTDGVRMEIHQIPWEDWNAQWTAAVQPIHIGHRVVIRPSWKEAVVPENAIELILDPKQAFGTGHHVTTQLLIEWLEEIIQGNEQVLDVGTGTGILAMVALRLGAGFALGIDQDPVAIECAKGYAVINGFESQLHLRVESLNDLKPKPFHLILANLDRQTLLSCSDQFQKFKSYDTTFLVSGILQEGGEDTLESFGKLGWSIREVRERDGWLAISLKG